MRGLVGSPRPLNNLRALFHSSQPKSNMSAPHNSSNNPDHGIIGQVPAPVVAPDVEMVAGVKSQESSEKGIIEAIEDVKDTFEDPNSPDAILNRYPLLRDKSEDELAKLNHQLRRRM